MSTAGVKIRAYNVRFGDCVLVSIPAGGSAEKHILFDFGNAPPQVKRQGGRNDVFEAIARNIKDRTNGVIDVLVMSHEHLDHMEGFYDQRGIFDTIKVNRIWMSLMSHPTYYDQFPKAERQKKAKLALKALVERWKRQRRFGLVPRAFEEVVANNNVLDLSNVDRIEYLRKRVTPKYLSRTRAAGAKSHGLGSSVRVKILAPESDASVYYAKLSDHALSLGERLSRAQTLGDPPRRRRGRALKRPPHMAADEFDRLKDEIAKIDVDSVFAIDKAANNTSLVVRLTVNGKVLLFCGDAEEESWAQMAQRNQLSPVDFLKIAHHGSINGMPFEGAHSVIQSVLKPGKKTVALVSTCRGVYGKSVDTEIPHHRLMAELGARCKRVYNTEVDAAPGQWIDITL